jgi:hypothetical protein
MRSAPPVWESAQPSFLDRTGVTRLGWMLVGLMYGSYWISSRITRLGPRPPIIPLIIGLGSGTALAIRLPAWRTMIDMAWNERSRRGKAKVIGEGLLAPCLMAIGFVFFWALHLGGGSAAGFSFSFGLACAAFFTSGITVPRDFGARRTLIRTRNALLSRIPGRPDSEPQGESDRT